MPLSQGRGRTRGSKVSVRDYHPRPARRGSISGCSVDGNRCAAPYQSDLGVEIHGEFRGCAEAAGMGGKVREVSCQRTFRGEILRAKTGAGEHVLLLGETTENGHGHGVVRTNRAIPPRHASATTPAGGKGHQTVWPDVAV